MLSLVSIAITTWNSAPTLVRCLDSVLAQDYPHLEVIVVDNASADDTRSILDRYRERCTVRLNSSNTGFAAAQNLAIRHSAGEWVLSLNPDVVLRKDFISQLVTTGETHSMTGTVCGKLLRWTPAASPEFSDQIDSTGIYFTRTLRHLDRGGGQQDRGQYDRSEFVFGATGAGALYRRRMIDDISVFGEFFDEDFFAYREDADLAWRAQLMGWRCLYVPGAVGWHVRRVTPERRSELPLAINWHSIKNRFLMRTKNISGWLYARLFPFIAARDLAIVGYAILRDWRLLSALVYPCRVHRALSRKRQWIQTHRRIPDQELARWFA